MLLSLPCWLEWVLLSLLLLQLFLLSSLPAAYSSVYCLVIPLMPCSLTSTLPVDPLSSPLDSCALPLDSCALFLDSSALLLAAYVLAMWGLTVGVGADPALLFTLYYYFCSIFCLLDYLSAACLDNSCGCW